MHQNSQSNAAELAGVADWWLLGTNGCTDASHAEGDEETTLAAASRCAQGPSNFRDPREACGGESPMLLGCCALPCFFYAASVSVRVGRGNNLTSCTPYKQLINSPLVILVC